MTIRKLTSHDIPAAGAIFTRCIQEMNEAELYNWTPAYPTENEAAADQQKGTIYGVFDGDTLLGFCTLDTSMVPQYDSVPWTDTSALCIHRLAVDPPARRCRVAASLLAFAEKSAKQQGLTSLRVDSFSRNYRAVSLYEQAGFVRRGEIFYPAKDERVNHLPFYVFEKVLRSPGQRVENI